MDETAFPAMFGMVQSLLTTYRTAETRIDPLSGPAHEQTSQIMGIFKTSRRFPAKTKIHFKNIASRMDKMRYDFRRSDNIFALGNRAVDQNGSVPRKIKNPISFEKKFIGQFPDNRQTGKAGQKIPCAE